MRKMLFLIIALILFLQAFSQYNQDSTWTRKNYLKKECNQIHCR